MNAIKRIVLTIELFMCKIFMNNIYAIDNKYSL